ncbi:MAG: cation:proton antiporter [Ornithinimicrobium sp.]
MAEVLLIAVIVFGFGMFSKRLAMSPLTAPMVYTTFGLIIGGAGLGWFDLRPEGEALTVLIEATLVLVLFTDAVRINVRSLRRDAAIPVRLLGVGLPLTLLAGTATAAVIFPSLGWAEALLLAAVLAPTDAALGQAVVSDKRLPMRVRQSLNVESGLNDGIMVPVVTIGLALSAMEAGEASRNWGVFVAAQIGFGLLCGVVAGYVGGKVLDRFASAGRVEGVYRQLATLAVAGGAYAGASLIGGNGFVAAFTAGIVFGVVAAPHCRDVQDFTQDEADLLTAITFVLFGAVLVPQVLGGLDWRVAGYAVLSLTVVRMVPVALAMIGSGTVAQTRLFVGWFGPRGLASILFALLVVEDIEGSAAELIFTVAIWTVLLSVFAHGASASPWTGRLATRLAAMSSELPEHAQTVEHPTRRRLG